MRAHAHEALDAARVHGSERVHLQEATLLVLEENNFGQHEAQVRKRTEKLIGGRGVFRVKAVEREEHRGLVDRARRIVVFDVIKRRKRNAAAKSHEAHGTLLRVEDELVGEALLQHAECIDDVSVDRHRGGINLGHDGRRLRFSCSFGKPLRASARFYHAAETHRPPRPRPLRSGIADPHADA